MPLNSVPYIGHPPEYAAASSFEIDVGSSSVQFKAESPISSQPAMLFLPSPPTQQEWNNIVAATKSGVALTGSAALGKMGPAIGLVDMAESEDDYVFRVSLPGVKRDENFSCTIRPNGTVVIKGVTSTGEKTVQRHNMVFEMQTHNLCPPGEFSVSFDLPGPVDYKQLTGAFGSDGIFEGVVKKKLPEGP